MSKQPGIPPVWAARALTTFMCLGVFAVAAPAAAQSYPNRPGSRSAAGFAADGHPCVVDGARLECGGAAVGAGTLAVLPEDITLEPGTGAATDAVVTSSLYGRASNDVVVQWQGIKVRCRVPGRRYLVGERVAVGIRRAMFYEADAAPRAVAAPASVPVRTL